MNIEKKKERPYIVAISFESDQNKAFLENALHLAERTGRGLCLCHVIPVSAGIPRIYDGRDPGFPRALDKEILIAEYNLQSLIESLPPEMDVSYRVLIAPQVADGLCFQAEECDAPMILLNRGRDAYDFTVPGESTIISLIQSSSVPLLTFPRQGKERAFKDGTSLRIFVADNLRASGGACVSFIGEWVRNVQGVSVCQFHCESPNAFADSGRTFSQGWEAGGEGTSDEQRESAERIHRRNAEELRKRGRTISDVDSRVYHEYRALVTSGPLTEALEREISDFDPDIVAFGKHAPFHTYEAGFSQLPLSQILEIKRPVLVVPCSPNPKNYSPQV